MGRHTPLVTLRKIGEGHCEELVLRQEQSGHVVVDTQHLTVVRAVEVGNGKVKIGTEMRKRKFSGSGVR